ncbi:hypothetical protein Tco_0475903 [Tanacetum coccineum]
MKNNSVCKENGSNVFRKEREQYHEIQDLKAQMQDKNIAISELKKLIENCKGKSVETQFNKPSVVRQPNAQRIPKPSVLGKPTPFSNSPEMRSFQTKQSVNKTNVSDGLFKQVTQQNLPQIRKQAVQNTNVIAPGPSRNNPKHVSSQSPKEFVGSNDMVHNYYLEKAKKSAQLQKDKEVNGKPSMIDPARLPNTANGCKPKPRNWQASMSSRNKDAKSHKTTKRYMPIEKSSASKKPERQVPTGHRFSNKKTTTVPEKTMNPRSCLRWKPTGRIFSNVRFRWIPTGKLFNSCTGKVDSKPTHGSIVDIPHIHACKQTLGLSAADQALVFMAMTSDHNRSELGIHDHSNEPSSLKLVPKVVPLAVKTATSRQELELLFHHHIAMLRTTGINPMIQPEPEDLPKDNPKLEIAVLSVKRDPTPSLQVYDWLFNVLAASRPDIMFAVCAYSRFQVTPKSSHLSAIKKIFRYLKGKPKLGLWYPKVSSFDLESYSDSDYAGANLDRKSTTGEAEYVAAASCYGQVLWIQNQMLDYGFNFMNTKIYIDNESTIYIVKNPVYHSKTKHIAIRYHFIRDTYEKKLIQVLKIHTDDNVADLLTKAFDVSRGLIGFRESLRRVIDGTEALLLPTLFILWLDTVSTDSAKLVPLGKVCTAIETLKKNTAKALISLLTTITLSTTMAVLDSCPKHNMVAYLGKSEGNAEFHEIINFLTRSSIHHALTISLVVSTIFVEQFWTSAKSKIINNVRHITAKVAGKSVSISEASIRSDLLFDDADGIDSLPNQAIFDAIQLMGSKSTSWDQIPTNIATAVICLTSNQKYNFSKLIFDDKQLANVPVPLDHFPINTLTSKVFSFMVKKGKHFSGKVTPLFASMLVQPTEDEGAPSERPSEAQPTPSPAPTSKVPIEPPTDSSPAHTSEVPTEKQTNLSPRPSPSTIIPDSIPETSGGNLGGHSSNDKSLSGNEGEMTL